MTITKEPSTIETVSEQQETTPPAQVPDLELGEGEPNPEAPNDESQTAQETTKHEESVSSTDETSDETTSNDTNSLTAFSELPSVFICSITKELMENPVVAPTGESFERYAILEEGDYEAEKLYPNRALLAIMVDTLDRTGTSLRAGFRRLEQSMRQSISAQLESDVIRPLHDAYYCPITMDVMHEPVIDKEGNTFERVAIEGWIGIHNNSPLTRNDMELTDLYPNNALQEQIQTQVAQLDESEHPWVQRWKTEIPMPPEIQEPSHPDYTSSWMANTYPGTQEELEQMQRQRRERTCAIYTAVVILYIVCRIYLPEGDAVFFFAVVFLYCIVFAAACRRRRMERQG